MHGAVDTKDTHRLVVAAESAYIANAKMYVSWNTRTDDCDAYPATYVRALPLCLCASYTVTATQGLQGQGPACQISAAQVRAFRRLKRRTRCESLGASTRPERRPTVVRARDHGRVRVAARSPRLGCRRISGASGGAGRGAERCQDAGDHEAADGQGPRQTAARPRSVRGRGTCAPSRSRRETSVARASTA